MDWYNLQNYQKDKTYLIDGFPRNQENFESWVKTMGDSYHFKKLLFFDCDEVFEFFFND
jgi:adenylate kinase family enzyme